MNKPIFKTRSVTDTPLRVDIYDTDGETFYGAVWVNFRDNASTAYSAMLKRRFDAIPSGDKARISKPRTEQDRRDSAEWGVRLFVEEFVVKSEIESADGTGPLKHDPAILIEFFMAMEFAFDKVVEQASNYGNFKKVKEETEAKNA